MGVATEGTVTRDPPAPAHQGKHIEVGEHPDSAQPQANRISLGLRSLASHGYDDHNAIYVQQGR